MHVCMCVCQCECVHAVLAYQECLSVEPSFYSTGPITISSLLNNPRMQMALMMTSGSFTVRASLIIEDDSHPSSMAIYEHVLSMAW